MKLDGTTPHKFTELVEFARKNFAQVATISVTPGRADFDFVLMLSPKRDNTVSMIIVWNELESHYSTNVGLFDSYTDTDRNVTDSEWIRVMISSIGRNGVVRIRRLLFGFLPLWTEFIILERRDQKLTNNSRYKVLSRWDPWLD